MPSQVDIVNMALVKLEIAETIQSLNDNNTHARRIRTHWENALACVLAEHDWGFATKSHALARLSETPPIGWDFAYAYPVDQCLRIRRVLGRDDGGREEFAIVRGEKGRIVVSNAEAAVAVYTVLVDNTYEYPPQFVEALAWRLAAEMSMAKQASVERYQAAIQTYDLVLRRAMRQDSREGHRRLNHDGPWLDARK